MTVTPEEGFQAWNTFLGPVEGGFSVDPRDRGNWTGGSVGVGVLKGTKFGIAASAHPHVDIANLTIEEAVNLRRTEYWNPIGGQTLHPSMAFVVAEAAYGSGQKRAIQTLQRVLEISDDGVLGPATLDKAGRVATAGIGDFVLEFNAQRFVFLAGLGNWTTYGLGWSRRLLKGTRLALGLANGASSILVLAAAEPVPLQPIPTTGPASPTTLPPMVPTPVVTSKVPPGPVPGSDPDNSADDLNAAELARIRGV